MLTAAAAATTTTTTTTEAATTTTTTATTTTRPNGTNYRPPNFPTCENLHRHDVMKLRGEKKFRVEERSKLTLLLLWELSLVERKKILQGAKKLFLNHSLVTILV